MPHDINGNEVKAGDRVLIEFEVISVQSNPEFCNMLVKPVRPMPGKGAYQGEFNLNTKQGALAPVVEKQ
jgi:hypothetical protein